MFWKMKRPSSKEINDEWLKEIEKSFNAILKSDAHDTLDKWWEKKKLEILNSADNWIKINAKKICPNTVQVEVIFSDGEET